MACTKATSRSDVSGTLPSTGADTRTRAPSVRFRRMAFFTIAALAATSPWTSSPWARYQYSTSSRWSDFCTRKRLTSSARPPSTGIVMADASSGSQPLPGRQRSEEHTSELQSPDHLVCRLLLEKKKTNEFFETTLVFRRVHVLLEQP